ncbi:MarR family transcriptional regulator [Paenibacillus psychroresistens]|uniref:MarR family transcriptional regulator n=1 Tax=Paenibacillus psychroresistens TaxID=1778678 RepID=A0A6B8RNQ7_9BACL|nr:MarR family transcriptional regulator [Paenibacillus psychroresistens]QGQ97477.1 MarR family transcriptional regulator [Paenibacillus psychroresistens]
MSSHDEAYKDQLLIQMQSSLETLSMQIKQEIQQMNEPDNLAGGQFYLLHNLSQKGTINASEVANMIGITSGAVTGMTDKLVSMGLITRERSETDRRVVLFSITDRGNETIKRIRDRRFKRITELFRQINNSELETTINVFDKITSLLENGKNIRRD